MATASRGADTSRLTSRQFLPLPVWGLERKCVWMTTKMRRLRPSAPRGLGQEQEVEVVEGCSPAVAQQQEKEVSTEWRCNR
nr:uncharacterized protein LOC129018954 isoform X2 [Pongo pygmaeus]